MDPKSIEWMTEQRDRLKREVDDISPRLDAANLRVRELEEGLRVTKAKLEEVGKIVGNMIPSLNP